MGIFDRSATNLVMHTWLQQYF